MDGNLPETTIVNPALKQAAQLANNNFKIPLIIGGIIIVLILVVSVGYYFLKIKPQQKPIAITPTPTATPTPIQGAKFILQSDLGEATIGGELKVTVFVKSDLDAANLFIAKLKFPNQLLQAKSISLRSEASSSGFIKDWFISNWVENTIDNNTGSVSLVGAVPNPGFQTQSESSGSAMADVLFTAKNSGDGVISFDDTSAVYRNSDNSNILASKQNISFKVNGVSSPSATLTPTLLPTPISSPSATPTGPLEGDVNQDGKVDLQDLSTLLSLWGKSTNLKADLNIGGIVNAFDYSNLTNILKDVTVIQ
jgi:hypothetical protein